ncbi:hypothetical protein ACQ86N_18570 [Puia sp. P3]|uniref:hypothetical protein n=1 Tax=Puia sp. P3 TaxID=3423952 RepID=UPI003D6725C7
MTVTVEIPMVCDTVAAGLGVLGVVTVWLRDEIVVRASNRMAGYLAIVSVGIFSWFWFDSEANN